MKVPNFKDLELTKFLVDWAREFDKLKKETVSNTQANKSVLLYSPSKKVYEVTVSDTGVLTATHIAG